MKSLDRTSLCVGILSIACGTVDRGSIAKRDASATDAIADASNDNHASHLTDADLHPTCVLSSSSTLPHVHIQFTSTNCVFTLAEASAGIVISYDVVIDQDVPGFAPVSPYWYGADVAGLDLSEVLQGNGQSYCLCDMGLPHSFCPLDDGGVSSDTSCAPITLKQGVYHQRFPWDGVNWRGPSDTFNPKGAPFPAGDYTLTISTAPGVLTDGGFADAGSAEGLSAVAKFLVRLLP